MDIKVSGCVEAGPDPSDCMGDTATTSSQTINVYSQVAIVQQAAVLHSSESVYKYAFVGTQVKHELPRTVHPTIELRLKQLCVKTTKNPRVGEL